MIEFTQATNEAILSILPQEQQCDSLYYGKEVFEQGLVPLDGLSVAVHEQGQCIGAYGVIEMWPKVARVWALFSEELIVTHPAVLGRHICCDLERAIQLGFHRIEATTGVCHEAGMKFLDWLGFTQECRMRRYTPDGLDTYLYAKVRDV